MNKTNKMNKLNKTIERVMGLYRKHRSLILYVFWGGVTTIVYFVVYFTARLSITAATGRPPNDWVTVQAATALAWVVGVAVAFLSNKRFVFESRDWSRRAVARELAPFVTARLMSLFIDMGLTQLLFVHLRWNEPLVKVLNNIVVLIFNYVASRFVIFRKKKTVSDNQN